MSYKLEEYGEKKGERLSDAEQQQWLSTVVRDSNDAIILVDRDGRIIAWNHGAEQMYGYPERDAIGRDIQCIIPEKDRSKHRDTMERVWRGEDIRSQTARRITRDSRILDIWLTASLISKGRKPFAISTTERDITKTKKEKESTSNLAAIVESSDDAILSMSLDGVITSWNPAASRLYGYTSDEAIGRPASILIPPALEGEPARMIENVKRGGQVKHYETRRVRKGGTPVDVSLAISPIKDPDGNVTGISWISQEITESRRIRNRVAYLATYPVYYPNPIIEMDLSGNIRYLNPAANRLFPDLKEKAFRHPMLEGLKKYLERPGREVLTFARDTCIEESCYLENIVLLPEKNIMRIYTTDITMQKQIEKELQKSEAHLKKSQEIAHIGSWTWDLVTNEVYWSDETFKVRGIGPGQDKPSPELYFSVVHPDDVDGLRKQIDNTFKQHNRSFNIDYRVVRKDGYIRYLHSEVEVEYDSSGKPIRLTGTGQDITERKQAELALESAKAQVELYLDLMSHDIRNYNQIAEGFLELALDTLNLDQNGKELLARSMDSVQSSSRLIDNVIKLQKFKGGEALKIKPMDLCRVLADIGSDYTNFRGRQITINFNSVPGCYIMANELVNDIFENLVGNAIKHSDPGKPLMINLDLEHVKEKGRDYLKVAVEDDGVGIPDVLKGKLFARYQEWKTKTSGRGLGLFIVMSLVRGFHGDVWVEDRVTGDYRKGARFVVVLPEAPAQQT